MGNWTTRVVPFSVGEYTFRKKQALCITSPHPEANVHRERDDVVVEYHPQQEHLQNPKN